MDLNIWHTELIIVIMQDDHLHKGSAAILFALFGAHT